MAPIANKTNRLQTVLPATPALPHASLLSSHPVLFWVFLALGIVFVAGLCFIAAIIFYRRSRRGAKTSGHIVLSAKFRALLMRTTVATKSVDTTTVAAESIESKGSPGVDLSESEVINHLLAGGNPIPWVLYDPKKTHTSNFGTQNNDSKSDLAASPTLAPMNISASFEKARLDVSDSEGDIVDILDCYMSSSESVKTIAPISMVPNIVINICGTRLKILDVNFSNKTPESPVIVQHDQSVDLLKVPPMTYTQAQREQSCFHSASRRSLRSNVTGKKFILMSPAHKKAMKTKKSLSPTSFVNGVALAPQKGTAVSIHSAVQGKNWWAKKCRRDLGYIWPSDKAMSEF